MERLIREDPVDKKYALGSMTSVKESIIRTHSHLKDTGTHMTNSISILASIINIAKEVKVSKEYVEVLDENPDFMEGFLDDVLDSNTKFWENVLKNKGIKLSESEITNLKRRQKILAKSKIKTKLIKFDKFKVFIQELISKTQDLGNIAKKIQNLKENLGAAKKENKKAQQDQETSINLMEALCDDFNEQQKIDELTGLGNKKYFDSMAKRFIETNKEFHVVFIDLNGLKQINDTYGHDAGDSILQDFAKDLANVLGGDKNTAFRLHGDEYSVISEDDLATITMKMTKLTEWLDRRKYKVMDEGKVVHIEGKFAYGITKKEKGDDVLDLKGRSEKKMYAHKARMKGEEDKYKFGEEEEILEQEAA